MKLTTDGSFTKVNQMNETLSKHNQYMKPNIDMSTKMKNVNSKEDFEVFWLLLRERVLKKLDEEKSLKLNDLADHVNVSRQQMYKWLHGVNVPNYNAGCWILEWLEIKSRKPITNAK